MKQLLLFLLVWMSLTESMSARPNLVLIFIDDMGYGDIGPFGSQLNRTPHLDRMAKEGRKLTSFYAAPVCSASRAQLLTGCYAPRVGVPGVFFPAGRNGLNPQEHTVAEYLRELGYATMCVGKWHLGDQPEFLPTRHGFDGYFGIPYSNDMGRTAAATGKRVHPLLRDDKVAELLEDEGQRRITREYTEEAVKFIEASAKADKNFFLYLPHTAMHVPLYPHPDFSGKSKNGVYGDWVEEVDWSVGQVLGALKKLKLAENTLVLFTSDNGPWASKGKAGGVSGPLRGSKGCTLEGGVREPTLAWWPGTIAPGTESAGIAGTTDVLPTFVSLAGGKIKQDVKIDGLDVSDWLLGKAEQSPRDTWHYFRGTQLQAVRQGPWKLALTGQSLGMGIRQRDTDLAKGGRLYNLEQEIGEQTDLAAQHPDIIARLTQLAETITTDLAANKRPAGFVENPVTLYPTIKKARRSDPVNPTKPIDWKKVKLGHTYSTASLPELNGKSILINATIEIPAGKKAHGTIIDHGGTKTGYALYAKQGVLYFCVRYGQKSFQRIAAIQGKQSKLNVIVRFNADNLSLQVGGNSTTGGSNPQGLLHTHPKENFAVGHFDNDPVDSESPKEAINGHLVELKVSTP